MDLKLIYIFVKVAQCGSFSRAAQLLKLPKSTVSKAVSKLEYETGSKLILRSTRSLSLTQAGLKFLEDTNGPLQNLEEAHKKLLGGDLILSGQLRITAPEDLGNHLIAPAIAKLSSQFPALNFELKYTNEIVDLVRDSFDIAVRIGKLQASSFKVRKLGFVVLILVATPRYLKGRSKIRTPSDLLDHDCLGFSESTFQTWSLRSAEKNVKVAIKAKILSNQMSSILQAALADGGIAFVPKYLCQREIEAGKLVHVLNEWGSQPLPVSLLTPLSPSKTARLKVTVDAIVNALVGRLSI